MTASAIQPKVWDLSNKQTGKVSSDVSLVQLTDTHLGGDLEEVLAGVNTAQSLDCVLELLFKQSLPSDLMICTGDLANNGEVEAYNILQQKLQPWKKPMAWLPGNHDIRAVMQAAVGELMPDVILFDDWAICLLDSAVEGKVGGTLGDESLQLLESCLQLIGSNKYVALFLHHQPIPVGSEWIDTQQVSDGDQLVEVVARHVNVKLISWGHVHQELDTTDERCPGVRFVATPSTCIQFHPRSKDFKLDQQMPGFRRIVLKQDGSVDTEVYRIESADMGVDFSTSGY